MNKSLGKSVNMTLMYSQNNYIIYIYIFLLCFLLLLYSGWFTVAETKYRETFYKKYINYKGQVIKHRCQFSTLKINVFNKYHYILRDLNTYYLNSLLMYYF